MAAALLNRARESLVPAFSGPDSQGGDPGLHTPDTPQPHHTRPAENPPAYQPQGGCNGRKETPHSQARIGGSEGGGPQLRAKELQAIYSSIQTIKIKHLDRIGPTPRWPVTICHKVRWLTLHV